MDRAGERLRRTRERLKLTYRDVAEASRQIAKRHGSREFLVSLSRLSDIENGGRIPTLFRLFSLCAIYRLDLHEVMRWYGIPPETLTAESLRIGLRETHPLAITHHNGHSIGQAAVAEPQDTEIDLNKTVFLSQLSRQWAKLPLGFVRSVEVQHHRYGLIGLEDWSMFPILRPGSLVLIDENRRRIARAGWADQFERPIYFLEHRGGFVCGWCMVTGERLVLQPHPASEKAPDVFRYPGEIEILGQVVGVAMLLDAPSRRPLKPATVPVRSRDLPGRVAAPPPALPAE